MQAIPARWGTPLIVSLVLGLSISLAKTFLDPHCSMKFFPLNFSSPTGETLHLGLKILPGFSSLSCILQRDFQKTLACLIPSWHLLLELRELSQYQRERENLKTTR